MPVKLTRSATALFQGVRYCMTDPVCRKLSLWPWIIGAVTYLASLIGAWYYHGSLVLLIAGERAGFLGYVTYALGWLAATALTIIGTLILTVVVVMVFAGVFQTSIAAQVLKLCGKTPPEAAGSAVGEASRTIAVETIKLLWLAPLFAIAFVLSLIPFFAPFAIIVGSWLLAFQFVDLVLDIYRMPSRERFRYSRKNGWALTVYGLTITAVGAIPFAAIVLPPFAAAGAAWLLAESEVTSPELLQEPAAQRKLS